MRLAIAVAAVLAMSSGANADFPGQRFQPCDHVPPVSARQQPTIAPDIVDVRDAEMAGFCHKTIPANSHIYGCTFVGKGKDPGVIFMNLSLTAVEYSCVLLYEEAHLPPNSWSDPIMEAMTPDIKR